MGAEWDHHKGGRAQWVAWLASVLASARAATRPGGRALVWSLPRTSHWTGAAVEEAGWAIETHVAHLFGQGWPKAKTQLKPAHELWWLARTGPSEPLGIDACRVGGTKRVPGGAPSQAENRVYGAASERHEDEDGRNPNIGRWPPTVVTSHTPWCRCVGARKVASASRGVAGGNVPHAAFGGGMHNRGNEFGYADPDGTETVDAWECVEGCPVAAVGEASGERKSGSLLPSHNDRGKAQGRYGAMRGRTIAQDFGGDTGTAARFFPQFPAVDPQEPCPIVYAGKVPPSERWVSAVCGCGVRVQMLSDAEPTTERRDGGLFCTLCNLARVHHVHPTQKSVALMRWFVRLVSAPGDLILDPFTGSGTTGVAALLEGRRFLGVERDEHHHAVACARLTEAAATPVQLALFGGGA
jgi:site-specific DNA-methyltransferase (adenine-specific)